MSESIRVMIYDKTTLEDGLDLSEDGLAMSWVLGGKLYKMFRRIDIVKGVSSWAEAFEWLSTVEPGKKISMVQFWGHGYHGAAYVARDKITKRIFNKNSKHKASLDKLRDRLTDDAVFWFRTCATFGTEEGHAFAEKFSAGLNCRVAGHTYLIGPLQSGLHSLGPGEKPSWLANEALDKNGRAKMSGFRAPNTITCIRGSIPKNW